jgi:hypothetical protein
MWLCRLCQARDAGMPEANERLTNGTKRQCHYHYAIGEARMRHFEGLRGPFPSASVGPRPVSTTLFLA